jgi:hypothetical protein
MAIGPWPPQESTQHDHRPINHPHRGAYQGAPETRREQGRTASNPRTLPQVRSPHHRPPTPPAMLKTPTTRPSLTAGDFPFGINVLPVRRYAFQGKAVYYAERRPRGVAGRGPTGSAPIRPRSIAAAMNPRSTIGKRSTLGIMGHHRALRPFSQAGTGAVALDNAGRSSAAIAAAASMDRKASAALRLARACG